MRRVEPDERVARRNAVAVLEEPPDSAAIIAAAQAADVHEMGQAGTRRCRAPPWSVCREGRHAVAGEHAVVDLEHVVAGKDLCTSTIRQLDALMGTELVDGGENEVACPWLHVSTNQRAHVANRHAPGRESALDPSKPILPEMTFSRRWH